MLAYINLETFLPQAVVNEINVGTKKVGALDNADFLLKAVDNHLHEHEAEGLDRPRSTAVEVPYFFGPVGASHTEVGSLIKLHLAVANSNPTFVALTDKLRTDQAGEALVSVAKEYAEFLRQLPVPKAAQQKNTLELN